MSEVIEKLTPQQKVLFEAIKQLGPCSAREIKEYLGWSSSNLGSTRIRLMDKGLIQEVDKIHDKETNRRVFRWAIIEEES